MSQYQLLKRVVEVLDKGGIDYMLTGSVASSMMGEPRSTHDIDLIVALSSSAVAVLLEAFPPPDFYLSEASIVEALQTQSSFNLLSLSDGEKVDFWILTHDPFDQSRFGRKQIAELTDLRLKVSSAEDIILMKLKWSQLSGGSEKQFIDALRVFELQQPKLDRVYLDRWAKQLSIEALWQRLQAAAEN
jgi:hypothetical protein